MQAGTTAAEAFGFKGSSLYLFPVLNSLQKQTPILLQVLQHPPCLAPPILFILFAFAASSNPGNHQLESCVTIYGAEKPPLWPLHIEHEE